MEELLALAQHVQISLKTTTMSNALVQNDIVKMCKKDKAEDIFRGNDLNNEQLYNDSKSHQRQIQYRFSLRSQKVTFNRIQSILSLGLAKGILYPNLILKRIEIQKKLFIMNIDGLEHV